ncbi:MAG: hypothetical protein AAB316_11970, partial [Bacteroidota bacterium]
CLDALLTILNALEFVNSVSVSEEESELEYAASSKPDNSYLEDVEKEAFFLREAMQRGYKVTAADFAQAAMALSDKHFGTKPAQKTAKPALKAKKRD